MNKNPKFCIIGRGSIGSRHLKNLLALGFHDLIAFSSSKDSDKDKEWMDKYGVKTLCDIQDLKNYAPDAFIIANPTSKHIEVANLALDLNAGIFMEKPLSHSLSGVLELRKKLIEKNLTFLQGNCLRFHPAFIKIKKMLEGGELGKIYFANIQCGSFFPDWHKDEDYRVSYAGRKDLGGGTVLTLQHEIDYAYWFFGKFKKVKSMIKKASDLEIDVEDTASIIAETEGGQLVEIHLDFLRRPSKRGVSVQGSKGSLDYQYENERLDVYDFADMQNKTVLDFSGFDRNQMYLDEMKHFIACLRGDAKPIVSIDDAIYTLEICLQILNDKI